TMRTGGCLDPTDKGGLAALSGWRMRTGGWGGRFSEEVHQELDQAAASLNIAFGRQSGTPPPDRLPKDFQKALTIPAGLVRRPAFEPARLELAKLQAIEAIRRRQDNPGSVAGREFIKVLYGANHPTARESTIDSVTRITRDDVLAFHQRTIYP